MTRRIGRPIASDGEQTQRRILDVALAQLGTRGYAKTTLKSIAEEAGVTSAAVYHHFRLKRDLVAVLLHEWTDAYLERVAYVADARPTLAGQLLLLLEEAADIYEERPHIANFAMSIQGDAQRFPELRAAVTETSTAFGDFYAGLVERAAARGELAPGVDPRAVQELFLGLTYGLSCTAALRSLERHRAAVDRAGELLEGRLVRKTKRSRRKAG